MTLQQKILAKQSKKGFTLVELVVVIAILAILAAIAIPAVIGIINSASSSAGESDAASVNSACKTLYSGIKSGTIVNGDTDAVGGTINYAASKGASASVRTTAANGATVGNAQDYAGLNVSYDDLYYLASASGSNTKGTIVFFDASAGGTAPGASVTSGTTLGALYN